MEKRIRIKKEKEFDNIIKSGKAIKNNFFILYYVPKKEDHSRFGIAVGTKIGNAVIRNKLKRQTREIIKLLKGEFSENKDYIIIVRKECLKLNFQEMKENLKILTRKVKDEKK